MAANEQYRRVKNLRDTIYFKVLSLLCVCVCRTSLSCLVRAYTWDRVGCVLTVPTGDIGTFLLEFYRETGK